MSCGVSPTAATCPASPWASKRWALASAQRHMCPTARPALAVGHVSEAESTLRVPVQLGDGCSQSICHRPSPSSCRNRAASTWAAPHAICTMCRYVRMRCRRPSAGTIQLQPLHDHVIRCITDCCDMPGIAVCHQAMRARLGTATVHCVFAESSALSILSPNACLLYTSPSPRDVEESRMPSSA